MLLYLYGLIAVGAHVGFAGDCVGLMRATWFDSVRWVGDIESGMLANITNRQTSTCNPRRVGLFQENKYIAPRWAIQLSTVGFSGSDCQAVRRRKPTDRIKLPPRACGSDNQTAKACAEMSPTKHERSYSKRVWALQVSMPFGGRVEFVLPSRA